VPQEDTITSAIEGAIAEATPEPVEDTSAAEGETSATEGAAKPAEGETPEGDAKAADEKAGEEQPKKKRGPIPYDRHEAVLTKARREAETKQKELQARIDALSVYENDDHKAQRQFLKVLETNPAQAVALLRQLDPERFKHLTWAEQRAEAKQMAAEMAGDAAQPAGEKPRPDKLFDDGTLGYTAEGAEKLLAWTLAQERATYQQALKELQDKVEPVLSERAAEKIRHDGFTRAERRLANAREHWRGFKEHEAEILSRLTAAEAEDIANGVTLADAMLREYQAVVLPKFEADRTKIEADTRAKVLAELNAKSRAGRTPEPGRMPAAAVAAESADPDERITNAIKESIAGLH